MKEEEDEQQDHVEENGQGVNNEAKQIDSVQPEVNKIA